MCDCEKKDKLLRLKARYEADIEQAELEIELGYSYARLNLKDRAERLEKVENALSKLKPCTDCKYQQQKKLCARQEAQDCAERLKGTDLMSEADKRIEALSGFETALNEVKSNLDEINRIVYDPLK